MGILIRTVAGSVIGHIAGEFVMREVRRSFSPWSKWTGKGRVVKAVEQVKDKSRPYVEKLGEKVKPQVDRVKDKVKKKLEERKQKPCCRQ